MAGQTPAEWLIVPVTVARDAEAERGEELMKPAGDRPSAVRQRRVGRSRRDGRRQLDRRDVVVDVGGGDGPATAMPDRWQVAQRAASR